MMPLYWRSERAFLLLIVAALASVGSLSADPPKMLATRIEIPERGDVPAYLFVIGTNKFTFMNPEGWKPEGKVDRHEVVFIAPDLDASLTLKISEEIKPLDLKATRESLP